MRDAIAIRLTNRAIVVILGALVDGFRVFREETNESGGATGAPDSAQSPREYGEAGDQRA
jgi:hypothetical protein